jgi:hypothetical protein
MKKLLITFFVIFISISNTYASSCAIKDKPIDALKEYIENNRVIINNINIQLIEGKKIKENTLSQEAQDEYDKTKSS